MKNTWIKKCWMLMLALCLLSSVSLAQTVTRGDLEISLTTDKKTYQAGEQIRLELSVRNHGGDILKPIEVRYEWPQTCMPVSQDGVVQIIDGIAGMGTETLSTTLRVTPKPQNMLPSTGDDTQVLLWLALAAGSLWGVWHLDRSKRRRLLSLALCIALLQASFAALPQARAQEKADAKVSAQQHIEIEISETVEIMGVSTQISAALTLMEAPFASAYEHLIGLPLFDTLTAESSFVYEAVHEGENTVLPESAHPYEVESDEIYVLHGGEGTTRMSLSFNADCEMEKSYDALLIYDGDGKYVTHYTGTAMRNKEIVTKGECVYIRLVADSTVTKYGFGFKKIVPHKPGTIKSVSLNSSNKPVIRWEKLYGHKGFAIERASVSSSGSVGAFKRIANKTSSTASSYTDKDAALNKAYAYRVIQYVTTNDKRYASAASEKESIYVLAKPVFRSGKTSVQDGVPKITLKWGAVKQANEYRIFRSTASNGTYECIASTEGTTYIDVLDKKAQYYYKVQAVKTYAGAEYNSAYSAAKNYGFVVAPLSLTAQSTSAAKVKLSWSKVQRADGYAIYRSKSADGPYSLLTRTTGTSKTVSAVASGVTSYFTVRAYTKSDSGKYTYSEDMSPVAAIFPLAVPTELSAKSNAGTGEVTLTWKAVPNADSYDVYYSKTEGGTYTLCAQTTEPQAVISGLADSLTTVYLKVRACRTDDGIVSESKLSEAVKRKRNLTTVRNLYIYEQYAPQGAAMVTYTPDRALLDGMFAKASPFGRGVSTVKAYTDQSKSQVKSRIAAMAKLADSNDVTVFVLSCHGDNSIKYGKKSGALCMSDGSSMTFTELAKALKEIPGRVVIMLTSCGSGSSINKIAPEETQAFLGSFIEAFKAQDEVIMPDEENPDGMLMPANGELMVDGKFYVIATALGGESGWYNNRDGSMLMRWMSPGVMGADTDTDGTVTLDEMADYLTWKGDTTLINGKERMYPQVYPDDSSFPLFQAH